MDVQPQSHSTGPIEGTVPTVAGTVVAPARRLAGLGPARSLIGAFGRTCRFDAALAMTTPAVAASAVAWYQTGRFDLLAAAFCLAATFAAGLGVHLLIEYYDRRLLVRAEASAARPMAARPMAAGGAAARGPQLLPGEIRSFGLIMLMISLVCSLWLAFLVGWPMALFGGVTLGLGIAYAAPPIRYGGWGYGLGESGIFVALGLAPAMAAYYAQEQAVSTLALWGGLPFALLGGLILICYTLLNFRRDWLIRKQTLPVSLGLGRAIDLSTVLLIGAFALMLLAAVVSGLPLRIMIALLGLPIVSGAYNRLDRENLPPAQGMRLYSAAIHATLAAALLFVLALFTGRVW